MQRRPDRVAKVTLATLRHAVLATCETGLQTRITLMLRRRSFQSAIRETASSAAFVTSRSFARRLSAAAVSVCTGARNASSPTFGAASARVAGTARCIGLARAFAAVPEECGNCFDLITTLFVDPFGRLSLRLMFASLLDSTLDEAVTLIADPFGRAALRRAVVAVVVLAEALLAIELSCCTRNRAGGWCVDATSVDPCSFVDARFSSSKGPSASTSSAAHLRPVTWRAIALPSDLPP